MGTRKAAAAKKPEPEARPKKHKAVPRAIDLSAVPRKYREIYDAYGPEGTAKVCEALGIDPAMEKWDKATRVEKALMKMDAIKDLSAKVEKLRAKHGFKKADLSIDITCHGRTSFQVDLSAVSRSGRWGMVHPFFGPRMMPSMEPQSGTGVVIDSAEADSVEECLAKLLPQD